MSWAPGDLALCVKRGPWCDEDGCPTESGPGAGEVHSVCGIEPDESELFLVFERWPHGWFLSDLFVKVTPGEDINGFGEPRRVPVKEEV